MNTGASQVPEYGPCYSCSKLAELMAETTENDAAKDEIRGFDVDGKVKMTVKEYEQMITDDWRDGLRMLSDGQREALLDYMGGSREFPSWYVPNQSGGTAEASGDECKVVASSTDGLTTDNPKQWFKLSCGHAFKLYGLDAPVACPVCGKAVMTRWFEQYTAYTPIRTTTAATTWGWQAIGTKCLGCKHHFLYGTANMCACASRTLVRTEHGDECASYCPRGGRR